MPPVRTPNQGPNPGTCPDWELNVRPFSVRDSAPMEPHQLGQGTSIFKCQCDKWPCQQPWEVGPTISVLQRWQLRLIQGHLARKTQRQDSKADLFGPKHFVLSYLANAHFRICEADLLFT